jgi:hypothetical protein
MRIGQVYPFLKSLKNVHFFSIQQQALCGHPDILLVINGWFVALELKAEDGKPRPLQKYHLDEVRRAGGISFCANEENWEEVKQILLTIDRGEGEWARTKSV